MSARGTLAITLAMSACLTCPASAASTKAKALVQQLGDESFEVRRRASEQLLAMGQAAISTVREGQSDADVEVSSRCKALIVQLEQARLKAFLADTKGRERATLPGWEVFAKLTGKDEVTRRTYAKLFRSQAELLESPDRGVASAKAEFVKRAAGLRMRIVAPRRDATLVAEVVALLVVGCDPRIEADAATWGKLLDGLDTFAERSAMVKEVQASAATRKLLAAVFQQHKARLEPDRTLRLALVLCLHEASELALDVATDPKMTAASRAWGLVLLGRLGDKTLVPKLLPLLEDKSLVGTRTLGRTTLRAELRDVALSAVVQLTGEKLEAVGFPYPTAIPGLSVMPSPTCLGFANETQRTAAFAKWRALAAKR